MKDEAFVRCFLIRKEALYANLLTCVFSASATLVSCKRKVYFSPASVLQNGSPLFFEAPVSVLRLLGSSSLVYIMLCNVFSALFVSITPNHFLKTAKLHSFICRLKKNLIYVAHFIFPNFIYFILLCTVL